MKRETDITAAVTRRKTEIPHIVIGDNQVIGTTDGLGIDLPVKMYIIDDLKTRLIVVALEVTRITITTTLRGAAVGILAVDTAPIEETLDHPAALDIPKNGIPPMTDGSTLLILPPPQDPWIRRTRREWLLLLVVRVICLPPARLLPVRRLPALPPASDPPRPILVIPATTPAGDQEAVRGALRTLGMTGTVEEEAEEDLAIIGTVVVETITTETGETVTGTHTEAEVVSVKSTATESHEARLTKIWPE